MSAYNTIKITKEDNKVIVEITDMNFNTIYKGEMTESEYQLMTEKSMMCAITKIS